jgi:peptide deformylase
MKIPTIIQEPHTTLRSNADPVDFSKTSLADLEKIINDMRIAMYDAGDGVAIAAPQIDVPLQIFMIAGFVFDQRANYHGQHGSPDRVFINPEIIKQSKATKKFPGEGCLSVRFTYGTTKRSTAVTIRAYDEIGQEFKMEATGFLAQIFQHEIDHLHGVLFIDHAHDIKLLQGEERENYEKELQQIKQSRKKHP